MGNVLSAGLGQNPARQAAVQGGVPVGAGALTINKVCGCWTTDNFRDDLPNRLALDSIQYSGCKP
jgi:hypothetical protein